MALGIYLNESVWSSPLVGYNKKQNRRNVVGSCYQKLRIYYKITATSWLLNFSLSYSIYSIITGSETQQVSIIEKFCVKTDISCCFIMNLSYGVLNPK